jgi:aspartate/methionine/tyrosine aminotransferase
MNLQSFKLERYFARYEFNAEFLLCSSDCEAMTIAELLDLEPGAAGKFQQTWLGYTESQGHPALRKEIAGIYESIQPEEILVHTGAEEAIFLFMLAALHENDHVIVHAPHYQSLSEIARGMGCIVSLWQAREENGWALDLDELRRLLRLSTKAIIINTPHNPTGHLMSKSDFEALHQIAAEHNLLVFCDEVYRESEYDPGQRLSAGCDMGEHLWIGGFADWLDRHEKQEDL